MLSFENPEKITPVSKKIKEEINEGGEEMETQKPKIDEKDWRKMVAEAIDFVRNVWAAIDDLSGKINEDELDKKELEELQRLRRTLGEDTMNYLQTKELGSISGGGALPEETEKREEKERQEEYNRIRSLTSEELLQEAEKYAEEIRKEDEETKRWMRKEIDS